MSPVSQPSKTRVAVYLRQSKDSEGEGFAIERQRTNCIARAEAKGWTVADASVYVDNNTSASSGKVRPAYQKLIGDVKAGRFDVVVAWNLDRLTRTPAEIEEWIDLNRDYGVNLMTSEGKDPIDLETEAGRLILRITAAVAKMEVERKGRRQRESNAQSRSLGLPPHGRRAFGYGLLIPDAKSVRATRTGRDGAEYPAYGHAPVEAEAEAIRHGYALLLAGVSLHAIAREWNDAGLATTSGAPWTQNTVRGVLTNPRYAALVGPPRASGSPGHRASRYDLSDLRPGGWEPIVDTATWSEANAVLRDPSRRKSSGAPRRWLLSGLATCGVPVEGGGVCGAPMKAGATKGGESTYRCSASYHLSRKADVADELVEETVIAFLSLPDAADLLTDEEAPDRKALEAELAVVQSKLDRVDDYYAGLVEDGDLSIADARVKSRARKGRLRAEVNEVEAKLRDAGKVDVLGPLISPGQEERAREAWETTGFEVRRNVVNTLMRVEMVSPGKGTRAPKDDAGRLAHTMRSVLISRR